MNIQQIFKENQLNNVAIIDDSNDVYSSLPVLWQKIAIANDFLEKQKLILDYWNSFKDFLPKINRLIKQDLREVCIVEDMGIVKMIYIFESNDDIITYQGGLPITDHKTLEELPNKISSFYKEIHNGWNDTISGGLGFLELDDIRYLSDIEWGVLDEINELDIELDSTFYVFHNGASGYLCISKFNNDVYRYLIWWADDQPQYNIDFWSYFDAWVQINFGYEDL